MKVFVLLFCFLPAIFCWNYEGYPGVDCPTARRKMIEDPKIQWMLPECEKDGTFQDLQCYDFNAPDTCMCCAPDGSLLTLPGYLPDLKSCVCFSAQYKVFEQDPDGEMLECESTGYFAPLQCSKKNKECWCVDRNGNVLVPPSPDVHSCENNAY